MRRLLAALALFSAPAAFAAPAPQHPQAEAQTLDLAKRLIALRTVDGPGNQTGAALDLIKQTLVAGGWQAGEVEIVPVNDTAYLIATWPGRNPQLKPLVISGHMDVVEAKAADWTRDPFTPVVENGYLFGRGASDMKFDAAQVTASLIERQFRLQRTTLNPMAPEKASTLVARRDLVVVSDADARRGVGHSIAAGVSERPHAEGWLVLPGDMRRDSSRYRPRSTLAGVRSRSSSISSLSWCMCCSPPGDGGAIGSATSSRARRLYRWGWRPGWHPTRWASTRPAGTARTAAHRR